MKPLSNEMQSQRLSLSPDELRIFLEIAIEDPNGPAVHLRFTNHETTEWNGVTWTNTPFQLTGVSNSAAGERSRPTLALPNEANAYGYYIKNGLLEDALVTRYKTLPGEDYGAVTEKHVFYVSHPKQITGTSISLELRRLSDGNRYKIPPNRYVQPEFPTVIV